jgi:hypothetical protein
MVLNFLFNFPFQWFHIYLHNVDQCVEYFSFKKRGYVKFSCVDTVVDCGYEATIVTILKFLSDSEADVQQTILLPGTESRSD